MCRFAILTFFIFLFDSLKFYWCDSFLPFGFQFDYLFYFFIDYFIFYLLKFAKNLNISNWLSDFDKILTFQGFRRVIIVYFCLIGSRIEGNKYFVLVLICGLNFHLVFVYEISENLF